MARSSLVTPTLPSMRKKRTSAFSTAYSVCLLICCSILRIGGTAGGVQADILVLRDVTSSVDQSKLQTGDMTLSLATIARCSGLFAHQRISSSNKSVEQGGLPDIGPPNERHRKVFQLDYFVAPHLLFLFWFQTSSKALPTPTRSSCTAHDSILSIAFELS